jgi:hypothetical protein
MRIAPLVIIGLMFFGTSSGTRAQTEKMNFGDRQAIVINNASSLIALFDFNFINQRDLTSGGDIRLKTFLMWKKISDKPIAAFEVVVPRYDPFNRPIYGGGRWLIIGHNSGDWTPLMPGESSGDGLIGVRTETVLTSVVYVRAIRFQDGNVWNSDTDVVEKAIRSRLPILKELGDVNPQIEKPKVQ